MEDAIKINIKYQKKYKKDMYTKPFYFHLIESFISKKELICYGGTAINVYLPNDKKFYEDNDIPDYDCFSSNPITDVKELADILVKNNIENVEVKAALFKGTYKIFANGYNAIDLSYVPKMIFDAIPFLEIDNIRYVHPSFAMIDLYRMLSEPLFSSWRWKKAINRLHLLQK